MAAIRHKLISASAGSGKTYQLVRRYLHLLALGEDATRITAVTFTRKAAGEFVNRILLTLADFAMRPEEAARFLKGLSPAPLSPPDFSALLRGLISQMPRLRLGTIDSFFAKVAASFPLELGQPLGAVIMTEEEQERVRQETVRSLLGRLYREQDKTAADLLLESFKQATFGHEEKKVLTAIETWLRTGHEMLHECGDERKWGGAQAVWPRDRHPHAAIWLAGKNLREAFAALHENFDVAALKDRRARDAWEKTAAQVMQWAPGDRLPAQLARVLAGIAQARDDLLRGAGSFKYQYCTWAFDGAAASAALDFLNAFLAPELAVACQRTRGIRRVVGAYEDDYARLVRSRGRLSFADLPRLLADTRGDGSRADDGWRSDLWYRLDGQVDHWLFDEFQDTSLVQWRIMSGLVDEALQDPGGRRTFFAVGDVKQSIYTWRKAEPEIFDHITGLYRDDGTHGIVKDTLAQSWRSSAEVLELVNGVFGDRNRLVELLGAGCLRQWKFETHTTARIMPGFSAFLQPAVKEDEKGDETGAMMLAAAILREVRPSQRGLSCAVLVRSNKEAVEMTEHLRAHTPLDILCLSEEHPAEDNPATAAVLAVLQLAAHPGDTLALQHLLLTPLRVHFEHDVQGGERARKTIHETLQAVHDSGFARVVEVWTERIAALRTPDVFSAQRLEKLADIAAEFDEGGSRHVDEFLEFARSRGVRGGALPSAVQVMTVHKSKGLEFDVVIVPAEGVNAITSLKDKAGELVMRRVGLQDAEWVLQYPRKDVAELDPVLVAQRREREEAAGFQALCTLYVAMTRAVRALYVVAPYPPKSTATMSGPNLLRATLGAEGEEGRLGDVAVQWLRTHGKQHWFEEHALLETATQEAVAPHPDTLGEILRRHRSTVKRSTPSGEEAFTVKGSAMFSAGRERGRRMGTLVHDLLAEIEWLDGLNWPDVMARWRRRGFDRDPQFNDAADSLRPVLEEAATRCVFQKPSDHAQVWREKPFEVIHEDRWISGTMDRVILSRDAAGRAVSAWLVDFKTDDVPDAQAVEGKVGGYRPQVELYRLAISRLTGLRAGQVRASLLFTRARKVVEIE